MPGGHAAGGSLSPEDVALSYKQLAEVERACRMMKSELAIRPMYHRKAERIGTRYHHLTFLGDSLASTSARSSSRANRRWWNAFSSRCRAMARASVRLTLPHRYHVHAY